MPGFNNTWTVNFKIFNLGLEKAGEPEIKLLTSVGSSKKQEFQKNVYFCFIDYTKAFDCVHHNKLWKILKEMEIPEHLTCLLRNLYACFLTHIQVSQETGKVVWYSNFLKNFPQFVVIHTVKGFHVVSDAEVDVFLEFPFFSVIHWVLAIWSLETRISLKQLILKLRLLGPENKTSLIKSPLKVARLLHNQDRPHNKLQRSKI